ncbi:MAG: UDP-N-acetyl glucosamine 2-epimerase, partial [Nitrospinota bacterium]
LVAAKSHRRLPDGRWKRPRIAHVEAGLRSFDPTMPEEINRRLTDALSDDLFIHSPEARETLLREGADPDSILEVGNLMIDTLDRLLPIARQSDVLRRLGLADGPPRPPGAVRPFALLTLHRPANVDDAEVFRGLLRGVARIAPELEVIFPIHPRVRRTLPAALESLRAENGSALSPIRVIEPLGYLDFIALMDRAALVLTDSGGVQEETTALGVPCLSLRDNTERPVTGPMGPNALAGASEEGIVREGRRALKGGIGGSRGDGRGGRPPLWDGKAGARAAEALVRRAVEAGRAPALSQAVAS